MILKFRNNSPKLFPDVQRRLQMRLQTGVDALKLSNCHNLSLTIVSYCVGLYQTLIFG